MRSPEQDLTFEAAQEKFSERKVLLGPEQMKTLGITSQDGVYTNLGLLLSDQCVHTINVAVFEGTNPNVFKDRKEFSGSLFKQMEEAYDYIDFHNQIRSTFEKLRRIDERDYPEAALREALLNSLVHREYSYRASTLISIYADRIEFTSIGGLVTGVTKNDVLMGISVCRNAKLANIFYRLELIEAYGTGMLKIMNAYEGSGRKPRIDISDNAFKIILPNLNAESEKERLSTSEKSAPEEDKIGNNGYTKRIIKRIKEQGSITRKEAEELLDIGQSTCIRLLKQMTEAGLIAREGDGRNTRYIERNRDEDI